jgi:hypothetical protein
MPSPEAQRANEALLERMLTDSVADPRTRMLAGKSGPNPTEHADRRMHMSLADIWRRATTHRRSPVRISPGS